MIGVAGTRWNGWALACVAISLLVALPVLSVLASLLAGFDENWTHLVETRLGSYLWQTAVLAVGVAVIALVVGTSTAWLVTMCSFPGRGVMRWLLLLPLAVPGYLAAYAYTDALQFSGPVQTWLREIFDWGRRDYWFPPIRSLGGAVVILGFTLYPYVYLAARTAFAEQSGVALEVGRTLGRGPWHGFFRVALPLARPSIVAGLTLVLMETLADFGVADYCAVDTFATGVYRTWKGLESPTTARQLSSVLLGFVALLVGLELLARRRAKFHQITHRRTDLRPQPLGRSRGLLALAVCALPVTVGFVGPAGLFVHMAITEGDARAWDVLVDHAPNTLLLATIAGGIAVVLALLVVYGRRLRQTPTTAVAKRFAGFGYALPGTVIAVGLLAPLGWLDHRLNDLARWLTGTTPGLLITGSIVAVVIGYQVRFLGVAIALIDGGLGRVRRGMDDAARALGSGGWRLLVRVHLPMLRASLAAALLLVFVDVAKELPATLMLRPFNFETLAVRVYQLASDERLEESAFGALAIIGIGLV
ncbi:MAG: iron ABC transporter permease, partial [Planctomycetota bacterium]